MKTRQLIVTILWILSGLLVLVGSSGCIFPSKYRVGLIPPFTDSVSTDHDPSVYLNGAFHRVLRNMRKADIKVRAPMYLLDKSKALNPGNEYHAELLLFYEDFTRQRIDYIDQIAKYNKVGILFWSIYTIDAKNQSYNVTLYGYRVRDKLYHIRQYTIPFQLDRQEMLDISRDNFSLIAEATVEG